MKKVINKILSVLVATLLISILSVIIMYITVEDFKLEVLQAIVILIIIFALGGIKILLDLKYGEDGKR